MEFSDLVHAVQSLNAEDAFKARLTWEQWKSLSSYLSQSELRAGELLIKQGETDRAMYFVGQGSLHVFMTTAPPQTSRIAILRRGAVLGEPSLFGNQPRMASAEAIMPCTIWALSGPRMEELSQRAPALAMEIMRSAGAVMAIRMRAALTHQMPLV